MVQIIWLVKQDWSCQTDVKPSKFINQQGLTSFFTGQFENKLLKAYVLWMNDSRIHRNMKIAWDDSTIELACFD